MKEFTLACELELPRPRSEVSAFFADAHNLETITPPWLKFEVLTPAPIMLRPGTLIDYRITVRGLPIRWRTEIVRLGLAAPVRGCASSRSLHSLAPYAYL